MRKLSKKISMLMVLAMLVGLFSGVVSASAASAWSFTSSKYDVAVNGSINMESKEYADFDLLKDGKAPAGYTVAWASSDKDVVWVNAKTGQLRANKFGKAADGDKAVISATFTNTATKKSATRSFTIVLGAAKDAYTVTAADATIALGEEVKFAPVVKNADGKVVKFATHKSYNGYFLDGKAITNPWTPEEAGEYTVTVAQFAKKANVTDLAKAVRKTEVKVTVTVDEFDAKATGIKEITVYGNFAKDATFAIKKNGTLKVGATATIAEDGKSATLALANRITKGEYTITCGDASAKIVTDDERAAKIVIAEKDGVVGTNAARTIAYVHYDVLNQYDESVRKSYPVTWTTSSVAGSSCTDKRNQGVLEVPVAASGSPYVYGSLLVVNASITNSGYPAFETATMTIGLENSVNAVEVMGITLKDSGKLLDEAPVSFLGGINSYYLVFKMIDRAGYDMDFVAANAKADLNFASYNPLLINAFDNTTIISQYIDGVEYGAIKLEAGIQLKKGGIADLKISSNKTGRTTDYALRVESDQILKEFRILTPEDIIIKNKADNGKTEVTLAFEAIDTNGELITDFRALYGAVSFSHPDVTFAEQNDGSAKLTYKVGGTQAVTPSKDYDYPVVITSIVPEGKGNTVTLYIKDGRYATSVDSYQGNDALLEGDSIRLTLSTNGNNGNDGWVKILDQYDEAIGQDALFLGDSTNNKAKYVAVKVQSSDGNLTISGEDSSNADGYYFFAPTTDVTLSAAFGATESIKGYVVEFALADNDKEILSGSSKSHTFYIADISECVNFWLEPEWPKNLLLQNAVDDVAFNVKANLTNGKTVEVQQDTAEYRVNYNGGANVFASAAATGTSWNAITGGVNTSKVDPAFCADKLTNFTFGKATQFENQAVINPDGTYGDRKIEVYVNGVIEVAAASGNTTVWNTKDTAKTTVEVGGFKRHIVTLNPQPTWVWKPWIVYGTEAYVNASEGKISYATLKDYLGGVTDNYGDNYSDEAGVAAGLDGVKVTITNVAESKDGLNLNSFKLKLNAITSDVVMIEGAEIGDTFTVTYEKDRAKHVIKFTVGADNDAKITTSKTTCNFY